MGCPSSVRQQTIVSGAPVARSGVDAVAAHVGPLPQGKSDADTVDEWLLLDASGRERIKGDETETATVVDGARRFFYERGSSQYWPSRAIVPALVGLATASNWLLNVATSSAAVNCAASAAFSASVWALKPPSRFNSLAA